MRGLACLLVLGWIGCGGTEDRDAGPPSNTNPDSGVVSDAGVIDPCQRCSPDALCLGGSCTCKPGYSGNGFACADVDECQGASVCAPNAVCTNTPGSYTCACGSGFTGDGVTCTPVDCGACDPQFNCGSGSCAQRFCDGRFGCYVGEGCGTIESVACAPKGPWETCSAPTDCPAEYYPGGSVILRFGCQAVMGGAARCWPVLISFGGAEPPPATSPVECPPPPPSGSGLELEEYRYTPGCETPPCEGNANQTAYVCLLRCTATSVCPFGTQCTAGYCL